MESVAGRGPGSHVPNPNQYSHPSLNSTLSSAISSSDGTAAPETQSTPTSTTTTTTKPAPIHYLDAPLRPQTEALRDGRVRNPIPSKLSGRDINPGSFNVMQMGIKKIKLEHEQNGKAKRNNERTNRTSLESLQQKSTGSDVTSSQSPGIPQQSTRDAPRIQAGPWPITPAETKEQQARLLTLLRSLQPDKVVEQLCQAVAYFGGIPGALPTDMTAYPPSAQGHGSGALFVGWVAEIFPQLDTAGRALGRSESSRVSSHQAQEVHVADANPVSADSQPCVTRVATEQILSSGQVTPDPTRRGRGRPRGSKGTKVRKDKGTKKGPRLVTQDGAQLVNSQDDRSWLSVDAGSAPTPVASYTPAAWAAVGQSSVQPAPMQGQSTDSTSCQGNGAAPAATQPLSNITATTQAIIPGLTLPRHETPKKRGRPKGRKNHPVDANGVPLIPAPPETTPKKRGRPPKYGSDIKNDVDNNVAASETTTASAAAAAAAAVAPLHAQAIKRSPPTPTAVLSASDSSPSHKRQRLEAPGNHYFSGHSHGHGHGQRHAYSTPHNAYFNNSNDNAQTLTSPSPLDRSPGMQLLGEQLGQERTQHS